MYTYKTIPAPQILGVRNEKDTESAIRSFSGIINAECIDGWEFYSMETMSTQIPQGCFSGSGPKLTTFNMLVFRKEI